MKISIQIDNINDVSIIVTRKTITIFASFTPQNMKNWLVFDKNDLNIYVRTYIRKINT